MSERTLTPAIRRSLPPDFAREAAAWIAADTVTTRSNLPFLRFLLRRFQNLGFRGRIQTVNEAGVAFANLLLIRGPRGRRPLLCNTHTDTVPPGPADRWTANGGRPFRLALRSGRLFGLGVADVKLNLLCQGEALRRLGPVAFRRPLVLAATYGEERGLRGARRLIRDWRGPKPRLVLVGEPSEGRPIHRHRGYLVYSWRLPKERCFASIAAVRRSSLRGRAAHSSTPHLGLNALERIFRFLARKEKQNDIAVFRMEGGTAPNQVPAEAWVEYGVTGKGPGARRRAGPLRTVPWAAAASALRRLKAAMPRGITVNLGVWRDGESSVELLFDVRYPPTMAPGAVKKRVEKALRGRGPFPGRLSLPIDDPALNASPANPAFGVLRAALRETRRPLGAVPTRRMGGPAVWTEKKTCTEAGLYHAWGVPAAVWGPGRSTGNVHQPNESIRLSDLAKAVDFYEALFRRWATS